MGAAIKLAGRRELLMGCGERRHKLLGVDGHRDWEGLVRLDGNSDVQPDIVHDLDVRPLPFEDNYFDEIHAYEVLEHLGRQGDYRGFFEEFTEYWRILKPNGLFVATVPRWDKLWAWSDPGHTRIITEGTLVFLSQPEYRNNADQQKPMTDYRHLYKADFEATHINHSDDHFIFALMAIKPSRIEEGR